MSAARDNQGDQILASKGRDLDSIAAPLSSWLSERLDRPGSIAVSGFVYPKGAGRSNETILFDADWQVAGASNHAEWVLRIHPLNHQLFLEPDFRMQYDLLRTLRDNGLVKVPKVLWFEEDPSWFGAPFFVMETMQGRVPVSMPVYNASGWLAEANPEQRRHLWLSAVGELARIDAVPVDLVTFLDKPELGLTGLDQQLELWRRSLPWSVGEAPPSGLLSILEWLETYLPDHRPNGLSWGDARIGNMMFGRRFRSDWGDGLGASVPRRVLERPRLVAGARRTL